MTVSVRPSWLFPSMHGMPSGWLAHDLPAGLVLAATALPTQLATARLAGLPPETGLLAFAAGTVGYMIFGSNRHMVVGADSTIAPIFAGGLAVLVAGTGLPYGELAVMLSLMVGVVLLAAGAMQAGWVADLLSIPVTSGFLAGISVHIAVLQLPTLLGIPPAGDTMLQRVQAILAHLPETNPLVLLIGAGVLVASLLSERLAPRFPGGLLAIAAAALAVVTLGLPAHGVAVLGAIHATAPSPALPSWSDARDMARLVPLAFIVTVVCMMQSAAVVRAFSSSPAGEEHVSPSFMGVGMGCVLAGALGAFPVNASPPLTSIAIDSGAKSQASGLFAVLAIALLVIFGGFLLAYVPQAALAGVLLTVAIRIFRLREIVRILRQSRGEFALAVAAALLVVVLPIESGMLLAIVLSLSHSLYMVARPLCDELARAPGTTVWWPARAGEAGEHLPGVLVFAPAAPLNFTNARFICRRLAHSAAAKPGLALVVIEASGVTDIDYTGAQLVIQTLANFRAAGVAVALARLSAERASDQAERTGLLAEVGRDRVFLTVEDAVRALLVTPRG
jgi:MFS superfamily sulfate permease-like transporter